MYNEKFISRKNEGKEILDKLYKASIAFIIVLIFSVAGYMYIERWNFLDAIYMTAITLATIGFQEVHPLSVKGKNIYNIFNTIWYRNISLYCFFMGYIYNRRIFRRLDKKKKYE